MNMLSHALQYGENGVPIFPVFSPIQGGGCSCANKSCSSIGKHPRTKNGFHDATTERKQIIEWWTRCPEANIGIRPKGGMVVLDIDSPKGNSSIERICDEIGPLPNTATVRTGGNGKHFYFRYNLAQKEKIKRIARNGILPGIDIKTDQGYLVAPPSLHRSGNRYEWVDGQDLYTEIAWLPNSLLELLISKCLNSNKDAHGPVKLAGCWSRLLSEKFLEGTRNNNLTRVVGGLFAKLSEADLPIVACYINRTNCVPPLPEAEVLSIVNSISVREYRKASGRRQHG